MCIESVMPSDQLPFLLLPSVFSSIRVFSNKSVLPSGGPSIGPSASVSVLPMNIQDRFPLGLTGLISLLSKGLSSLLQHHNSKASILGAQLSLWSNSHIQFQVHSKVIQILSDSVIHIYIYFFSDSFPYRLLQNIEHSSLCCIVSPCWLSILYLVVCIC